LAKLFVEIRTKDSSNQREAGWEKYADKSTALDYRIADMQFAQRHRKTHELPHMPEAWLCGPVMTANLPILPEMESRHPSHA